MDTEFRTASRHDRTAAIFSAGIASTIKAHYGWVMVMATFFLTGLCLGGVALVAVFLKPLAAEFGWQRSEIAMAYTVATVSTAFGGVLFSRISDLYGVRALSVIGALTIAVSLVALSQLSSLWQLYGAYGLFGAVGIGAISIPMIAAVTNWFSDNRGLALGIATAGGAFGQGLVPYIGSAIMEDVGWRDAYLYLGLTYLLVGLPLALLVRNPPNLERLRTRVSTPALETESSPLAPRETLAWICTAVVFCCVCMAVPIVHAAALASDGGFSVEQAARVLTIVMLAGAAGRVAIGLIADRIGPLNAYIVASFGQSVLVYWFVEASSPGAFYLLAAVFGVSFGGVMTSFLLTVRSLVPAKIAATAMAVVVLFGWVGMGLGAYAGGLLFDWSGSYTTSFGGASVSGAINITILLLFAIRLRRATYATVAA
jgi:MFS family permease